MSPAASALLREARAHGVKLAVRHGSVLLRGTCPAGLRERLREHRGDLLALLPRLPALLPAGALPDDPPTGWTYCRRGVLAGLWVGPDGELAANPALRFLESEATSSPGVPPTVGGEPMRTEPRQTESRLPYLKEAKSERLS